MRVLIALPGLHRVARGAETAFEEVARHLAMLPGHDVTVVGGGTSRPGSAYRFRHAGCVDRKVFEHWPRWPMVRNDCAWEELTFVPGLCRAYRPQEYDVTVTCGYPYANWVLRARRQDGRPRHVFVTQNGDWMCHAGNSEYRFFGCDGLVCTNPEYYERNKTRWRSALIPNGVDPTVYHPGPAQRGAFGLPADVPMVLMVSALIPSKRVLEGIEAVAQLRDAHMVVAGDGPLRKRVRELGRQRLGERFHWLRLPRAQMPDLYRCADVFLHMSQDEPSANAYLEALATGLPIVTEDRMVTRWTLEDCGLLVNTSDLPAVTQALQRAMACRCEQHLRKRRELAERRFSWATLAQQYTAFFREVCQS